MNDAIKQQAEGQPIAAYPPVTVTIECGDDRMCARFASLVQHILHGGVTERSKNSVGERRVYGTLDKSIDDFMERLDTATVRNAELQAERDHIMERLVMSEAVTMQLTKMLNELDEKRLAALILADLVQPDDFEKQRNKSRFFIRDTIQVYRDRARQSMHNQGSKQA